MGWLNCQTINYITSVSFNLSRVFWCDWGLRNYKIWRISCFSNILMFSPCFSSAFFEIFFFLNRVSTSYFICHILEIFLNLSENRKIVLYRNSKTLGVWWICAFLYFQNSMRVYSCFNSEKIWNMSIHCFNFFRLTHQIHSYLSS